MELPHPPGIYRPRSQCLPVHQRRRTIPLPASVKLHNSARGLIAMVVQWQPAGPVDAVFRSDGNHRLRHLAASFLDEHHATLRLVWKGGMGYTDPSVCALDCFYSAWLGLLYCGQHAG
jgi:hypothetical protein